MTAQIRWVDPAQMDAVRHVIRPDDKIIVHDPGAWDNKEAADILDWYAVSDVDGIFVYTDDETTAHTLADHFNKTAKNETIDEHCARIRSE